MFRVYKKIQEKRISQNPTPIIKSINKRQSYLNSPNTEFDKLIYKLNTRIGINYILSKKFKEETILTDQLKQIINILFKMWMENPISSVFKALKKILHYNKSKLFIQEIYESIEICIRMKKMTNDFYALFFKICEKQIEENKNELKCIIHADFLNRLV